MIKVRLHEFNLIHDFCYKGNALADRLAREINAFVAENGGSASDAPMFGDYCDATEGDTK